MPDIRRLTDGLTRNPTGILLVFCIYYVAQFIVRLLVPHGLRIDEAQQVLLSQWFAAGYDAQPPLYNWLQQATFAVVGDYLVGLSALKSAILLAVVSSYYWLARLLVRQPQSAAIATLAFVFIPQTFWQAQRDLTHTTATMLMTNLLLIAAVVTLRLPTLRNYILLGAAAGLGMLTKYNFALVLPALAVACLSQPNGLKRLLNPRILAGMVIGGLIVLPHVLWFVDNLAVASSVTAARMAEDAGDSSRLQQIVLGLRELLQMSIVICAPAALVIGLAFGSTSLSAWRAKNAESRFLGSFLAALFVILTLMIIVFTFTTFRDRWLLPLLQVVPIFLVLKLEAQGTDAEAAFRRLLPGALVVLAVIPFAVLAAGHMGRPSHYQQPYSAFHDSFVAQEAHAPSLIVTPDWLSAGNIKKEWPEIAVITTQFPNLTLPYRWEHDRPVALMWRGEAQTAPKALQNWAKDNLGDAVVIPEAKRVTLPFEGNSGIAAPDFSYVLIYP